MRNVSEMKEMLSGPEVLQEEEKEEEEELLLIFHLACPRVCVYVYVYPLTERVESKSFQDGN